MRETNEIYRENNSYRSMMREIEIVGCIVGKRKVVGKKQLGCGLMGDYFSVNVF